MIVLYVTWALCLSALHLHVFVACGHISTAIFNMMRIIYYVCCILLYNMYYNIIYDTSLGPLPLCTAPASRRRSRVGVHAL